MNMTPPAPRKAPDSSWVMIGIYHEYTAYQRGNYRALSSIALLHDNHQPAHWEWVVSFSYGGVRRLTDDEIKKCLQEFGAQNFVEDNHEAGIARKFWLAVEEKYRAPCPCQDENVIVEGDYRYSVKK